MSLTPLIVLTCRRVPRAALWGALISVLVLGSSCRPNEDPDAALRKALEARAAQATPRASVALGYIHQHSAEIKAGEPIVIERPSGQTIVIERLYLVTSAIELHGCESGHDRVLGRRSPWLRRLNLVASAHAHVPSSSTRLGVPFVEDLLATPNTARMIGGIAPPFGRYCRLYAILTPADDDVLNLTDALPDEIEGYTLLAEGRWRSEVDGPWQPFRLTSVARIAVEMPLIDATTHEPPLDLLDAGAHALVLVEKSLAMGLFDSLDEQSLAEGRGDELLARLSTTLRMYRYEAPTPR
jgi:hypothetical protein